MLPRPGASPGPIGDRRFEIGFLDAAVECSRSHSD